MLGHPCSMPAALGSFQARGVTRVTWTPAEPSSGGVTPSRPRFGPVGKAAAARRLASAAAFGGGGLSVLGAGLYGLLRGEAALARRMIGNAGDEPPPDSTGWYGRGRPGPAVKVAFLGDSSAAGYGVERIVESPGAFLASGLAKQADRRVHLRTYARVGAQSCDLEGQIDRALPHDPDLAVILIGANDVTHRVRPSQS